MLGLGLKLVLIQGLKSRAGYISSITMITLVLMANLGFGSTKKCSNKHKIRIKAKPIDTFSTQTNFMGIVIGEIMWPAFITLVSNSC